MINKMTLRPSLALALALAGVSIVGAFNLKSDQRARHRATESIKAEYSPEQDAQIDACMNATKSVHAVASASIDKLLADLPGKTAAFQKYCTPEAARLAIQKNLRIYNVARADDLKDIGNLFFMMTPLIGVAAMGVGGIIKRKNAPQENDISRMRAKKQARRF
jgi:hypothetical protein